MPALELPLLLQLHDLLYSVPFAPVMFLHCLFCSSLAPDFKDHFLLHYWLTFLGGFGGGTVSSLLLLSPANATIAAFSINVLGVAWTVAWWLNNYCPGGLPSKVTHGAVGRGARGAVRSAQEEEARGARARRVLALSVALVARERVHRLHPQRATPQSLRAPPGPLPFDDSNGGGDNQYDASAINKTPFLCWLPCWFPLDAAQQVHSFWPVKMLTKACTILLKSQTIIARVNQAVRVYPAVIAAPLILGTIGGCGGKLCSDAIRGAWGKLHAPAELTLPSFSWRSSFLSALAYYLAAYHFAIIGIKEAAALVVFLNVRALPAFPR